MTQDNWGVWRGGNVVAHLGGQKRDVWALYQNDFFIVSLTTFDCAWGACLHLVMRLRPPAVLVHKYGEEPWPLPLPSPAGLSWPVKQRIKDELVGKDRLAIEVFPPTSELVDQADAYHLWVLPEGFRLPFGVEETTDV